MLVDEVQLRPKGHCKLHHGAKVATASLSILAMGRFPGWVSEGKGIRPLYGPFNESPGEGWWVRKIGCTCCASCPEVAFKPVAAM